MGINYWEVVRMKKMKKLLSVLAVMLLIVCMAVPVSAAGKISKSKATLLTGQTLKLKLSGAKGKTKWTSSKKSVATVSGSGKVTAKKSGSATITAKVGKKKYTCKVTVESPKLSKKSLTLKVGKTSTIKVKGTKQTVKWKSSKKSVATVKNGKITAKKAGTANITATVLGKKFTCKVTVKKASNGGFSGNTNSSGKRNIVTYHAESTPYGAVAILENHYDYAVKVRVEFVYFLNGSMIGTDSDSIYAFAPHSKCALQGWNADKTWDSFKVNLKIEKASSNIILNNSGIHYSANFGNENVMVKVTNNGKRNSYTTIAVVFYKNGKMVGYSYQFAHVENPGSTSYLEFRFPYDRNYDTITPDKFEVYVNDSYTYNWMN